MPSFTYQPALRPDLPHIFGPKEYQESVDGMPSYNDIASAIDRSKQNTPQNKPFTSE